MRRIIPLLLLMLAGCGASLKALPGYTPSLPRLVSEPLPVYLEVTTLQSAFEFDSSITVGDVERYVQDGLAREFGAAGCTQVTDPSQARVVVRAQVMQVDMGFESFSWWYIVGYSSLEVAATAQLRIMVEERTTGRQFIRHFAAHRGTNSRKFWVYFIPISMASSKSEESLMREVSRELFGQVVSSVLELLKGSRT